MNIKDTFLNLTSRTYPHGTEHMLFDKLPQNLEMDDFGNLYIKIGDSDVMFTSHLDTATSALTEVKHVFDDNIIKTDGTTILGADDKAGVSIMLYMIENEVPGLYYFFLGEEVGCVGSKKVAEKHKTEKLPYINKVISFDRRGTDSVITRQAGSRCCSDKFASELATMFNSVESTFKYKTDPTGIYTDSAQFVSIYPECTNISVGYYSEHTFSERQDIEHLKKLAEVCIKIDWNSLPVERDPKKVENDYYDSEYGWGYSRYSGRSWNNYDSYDSEYYPKSYTKPSASEKINFWDEEYRYVSSIEINKNTGEIESIDLENGRLSYEETAIMEFLQDIEIDFETIQWNGLTLKIQHKEGNSTEVPRAELEEYVDELNISDLLDKEEGDSWNRNSIINKREWNEEGFPF